MKLERMFFLIEFGSGRLGGAGVEGEKNTGQMSGTLQLGLQ